MAAFPSTLPEPLLASYQVEPQPVSSRTEMEAGSARTRPLFTSRITNCQVGWMLSASQMTTFKSFYEDDIEDGTLWFDATFDLGNGNAPYECRFIDRYATRPAGGGLWVLVAMVEVK